jgi:hypothetical protein
MTQSEISLIGELLMIQKGVVKKKNPVWIIKNSFLIIENSPIRGISLIHW